MGPAVKRRLLAVLGAVALVFGLGTATAYQAHAAGTETAQTTAATATAATAATTGATGAITGYEGLCLDDSSASTADFNPIQVYTCNGTDAQQWTAESNDTLEVLGMCLDVDAAGT